MSRVHHLDTRRWSRFRLVILDRDRWRCRRCGSPDALEVHHTWPLEKGGPRFDPENCETLCAPCHIRHHKGEGRPDRLEWDDFLNEALT